MNVDFVLDHQHTPMADTLGLSLSSLSSSTRKAPSADTYYKLKVSIEGFAQGHEVCSYAFFLMSLD